ncbi:MAG: hypothetical protein C5B49_02625 [Bdellovibrio sp.]|nr:MAG: hypothetical protein C5B49_02625 [Bdellovibrio sp.]
MIVIAQNLLAKLQLFELQTWARKAGASVRSLRQRVAANSVVLISEDSDYQNLRTLLENENLSLLYSLRKNNLQDDLGKAISFLQSRSDFQGPFIRQNSKLNEKVNLHLVCSDQRRQAIEDFGNYVKPAGVFDGFEHIARTVASELLTNAFYNAPRAVDGRALQASRTEVIQIQSPHYIEFAYGDDGDHLWLRVTDPFGTFSRKKLLHNLMRCARYKMLRVRENGPGAGIGLYMIFRWASELRFEFEEGRRTTVLVKLLKTKRLKVFESQRTIFEVVDRKTKVAMMKASKTRAPLSKSGRAA